MNRFEFELISGILRYVVLVIIALVFLSSNVDAGDFKIITDMDDRRIEVPVNPKRIVSMHGVSSERIMILGKASSLALLAPKPSPWAYRLFPEIEHIRTGPVLMSPNIEEMIRDHVDLLIYSPIPVDTKKLNAAGIKTACGFSAGKRPGTVDDFMVNFKRQVSFFGDLMGPEAKVRADRYNAYFDRKVRKILARTSKIAKKERPTVYYGGRASIGGGTDILNTQGKASVLHWNVEIAGGNYLPQALNDNFATANREQILLWNPDVVIVSGWGNTVESVTKNPKYAAMKAVRNNNVHIIPNGVFAWEYASGESVLLMIYMAKIFHPQLFRDWNMKKEMKAFYSEVYGRKITDSDAERILLNLPPA